MLTRGKWRKRIFIDNTRNNVFMNEEDMKIKNVDKDIVSSFEVFFRCASLIFSRKLKGMKNNVYFFTRIFA